MKKLMLLSLSLSLGFFSVNAHAVGKDQGAPNCQQVIQSIQDTLKKNRPVASDTNAPSEPATGSTTAQ
jgi:hypothetical protein